MTSLADYTYYTGAYQGTAIASTDWPRLYLRAYTTIDLLTFGRATRIQKLMPAGTTIPADPTPLTEDGVDNNAALKEVQQDGKYHISDPEAIAALKNAICAVAEEYQRLDKISGNGGEISSESVGNNSVTYTNNSTANLSDDAKLKRVARMYLAPTGLMYAGVRDYQDVSISKYWGWWY